MNGEGTKQKMLSKLLKLDLSRYPITEIQVGLDPRGPKRCLRCQRMFKPDEVWRRMTSAADPQYGRYTVAIHNKCPTSIAGK
jgi:hypothetical protein